jgi:hypothetical protein
MQKSVSPVAAIIIIIVVVAAVAFAWMRFSAAPESRVRGPGTDRARARSGRAQDVGRRGGPGTQGVQPDTAESPGAAGE